MSKAQKIFTGVLAFLVIVLVVIVTYPNYHEGGNKSSFAESDSMKIHQDESAVEADKDHPMPGEITDASTKQQEELKYSLTFTAFKTPDKVGVPGTFDDIKLSNLKASDTISRELTGAAFVINTNSVNTNDATGTRDPKLKEYFFAKLASPQIIGSFNAFENGNALVSISMNGESKEFSFPYTETPNSLTINGKIDIVKDFGASTALASIAEACKDLHADKTWSEVDLKVDFNK